MIIIYGKSWNLSEPVGRISPPPFFICGILRVPAAGRLAAAASERSKKRRLTSPLFAGFFMKEKERDHIATPSLTADGIFGLPLRDSLPGRQ